MKKMLCIKSCSKVDSLGSGAVASWAPKKGDVLNQVGTFEKGGRTWLVFDCHDWGWEPENFVEHSE